MKTERKKNNNKLNAKYLAISSKKMCKDLIKLGCMPRKSLVLEFPNYNQVPKEFMRHFIRGVFDGDGNVYFNKKWNGKYMRYYGWRASVSITSSNKFCCGLMNFLRDELELEGKIYRAKHHKIETGTFTINRISSVISFMEWIYGEDGLRLHRKYNYFNKLQEVLV